MCGIAGKLYFDHDRQVSNEEIKQMTDAIAHRGPDDEGVHLDKNLGLGHRRLSIIDLSERGHQPMSDDEGRYWLTYNGEIYNFKSLRKDLEREGVRFRSDTDSEVIIYLFKKYGVDCVKHLRGQFAFAIWDAQKRELFLARDRVGQKPLKFYHDAKVFIFASELKAILTQPEVKKEIDWGAVDEYLSHLYVPHPKTGFKNIYKLEPGHYLIIKNGQVSTHRYWRLSYDQKPTFSEQEWKQKILEKLKESVRMRLMSDVPLGAHLSGGVDSSLIVALMSEQMGEPVKTYSIGFSEDTHNELPHARKVAERYGTDHHEFIVEPNAVEVLPEIVRQYEEPYADNSTIPMWYLSKLTREHVTVALNGDGGDENFAGYGRYGLMRRYYQARRIDPAIRSFRKPLRALSGRIKHRFFQKGSKFLDWYSKDPAEFYLRTFGFFAQHEKDSLFTNERKQDLQSSRRNQFMQDAFNEASDVHWLDQLLSADVHTYLPDDLLVKVDIASMKNGLELRSPFLDHEFMELAASMPPELKLQPKRTKYLLKKIAEDYLPQDILYRPKQGFGIPREKWLRTSLNAFMKDRLLDESFLAHGFNRSSVEHMIRLHTSGTHDYSLKLWALLMLQMWLHEFHH